MIPRIQSKKLSTSGQMFRCTAEFQQSSIKKVKSSCRRRFQARGWLDCIPMRIQPLIKNIRFVEHSDEHTVGVQHISIVTNRHRVQSTCRQPMYPRTDCRTHPPRFLANTQTHKCPTCMGGGGGVT